MQGNVSPLAWPVFLAFANPSRPALALAAVGLILALCLLRWGFVRREHRPQAAGAAVLAGLPLLLLSLLTLLFALDLADNLGA